MTSCFSQGLIVLIKLRQASWNYALVRLIFISSIQLKIGTKSRYLPNLKASSSRSKSQQYISSCGGYVSSLKTSLILLSFSAATMRSEWSKAFTSVLWGGCFGLDFFMAWEQRYQPMGRFSVFLFLGLRPVCGRLLLEECEQTRWEEEGFLSVFYWLSLLAWRLPSTILREMQFRAGLKGNSWRYCCLSSSLRCYICLWSSNNLQKRSVRCCWRELEAIYRSTCLLMALIFGWKGHSRISSSSLAWSSRKRAFRFSWERWLLCCRMFSFPNLEQISRLTLLSSGWFSLFSNKQFSPKEYFFALE